MKERRNVETSNDYKINPRRSVCVMGKGDDDDEEEEKRNENATPQAVNNFLD